MQQYNYIENMSAPLVKQYHPNAMVKLRPTGKKYYQVWDGEAYLGQGKSKKAAWKAAWNNINN